MFTKIVFAIVGLGLVASLFSQIRSRVRGKKVSPESQTIILAAVSTYIATASFVFSPSHTDEMEKQTAILEDIRNSLIESKQ